MSDAGDLLADPGFKQLKKFGPNVLGSGSLSLLWVRVESLEETLELCRGWVVAGKPIDLQLNVIVKLVGQAEDSLGLLNPRIQIATMPDGNSFTTTVPLSDRQRVLADDANRGKVNPQAG